MESYLISIVVPMHNEELNISHLYDRLSSVLTHQYRWELICVDDGSTDMTLEKLLRLREKDENVHVIEFSRNFGKEAALSAGLQYARGDAVIPIDADLQDPPELIPNLIQKWLEGFDLVNARRSSRDGESPLKKITAYLFYRMINKMSEFYIPEDTGDFRLLSRNVVDAILRLPERRRFMKGIFAWVGFKSATVYYHRHSRVNGKTSFRFSGLMRLAIEGLTSFTTFPLRLISYIGFFVSFLAFIYAIKIIYVTLFFGEPVQGFPTVMVSMLFLGGIQLMAVGIIGEYLGRVYEEVKSRPIYIVRSYDGKEP